MANLTGKTKHVFTIFPPFFRFVVITRVDHVSCEDKQHVELLE